MAGKRTVVVVSADKDGLRIRVDGNLGFASGDNVAVEIVSVATPREDVWQQFHKAVGAGKNEPEIPAIFDEIQNERRRGIIDP